MGSSGDKYEKEADSVADRVVSNNDSKSVDKAPAPPLQLSRVKPGDLQKKEAPEEESKDSEEGMENDQLQAKEKTNEEPVQMKCSTCGEETLQTKLSSESEEPVQMKCLLCEEKKEGPLPPIEPESVQAKSKEGISIQTKCSSCGEETNIQTKLVKNEEESVQAKCAKCAGNEQTIQKSGDDSSQNIESELSSSKGGGSKMDAQTSSEMESGIGADFSGVRIHTDSRAEKMNSDIGARAFTNGSDVYFNKGEYNPSSKGGQHLLAHELTHTVQQGASSESIQKKDIVIQRKTAKESAERIEHSLQGYTTTYWSGEIYKQFKGHRKDKAHLEKILKEVKKLGPRNDLSRNGMVDWMFEDMTAEDGRNTQKILVKAQVSDAERIGGELIYEYLSGYTSSANSGTIVGLLTQFTGSQLDSVLGKLESAADMSENDMRAWLFDDLTSTDAEKLRVHFMEYGYVKAAMRYGAKFTADKIYNLLSGYTSVSDSWAIVSNFKRTPETARDFVMYELNKLTGTDWGKRGATDALMQDLNKSDYVKLTKMAGLTLVSYDYEMGWLEWGWNGALAIGDWALMVTQWLVCGIVGIVTGLLSIIYDIIVMVVDIGFAAYHLVMSILYFITNGGVGSESWLAVKDFFRGLGTALSSPGEAISQAWQEMALEGALIEGPLEACKEAEFWVRKFINLIVNIILIFAAGYGAVKLGVTGLKLITKVIARSGFRKGIVKLSSMVLKGGKKAIAGASDDVIKVIKALAKPAETTTKITAKLNKIKMAAGDFEYWKWMRKQAGTYVQGEKKFWQDNRQYWDDFANGRYEKLDDIDGTMGQLADDLENENISSDSPSIAEDLADESVRLSDDVEEVVENVMTGTAPIRPSQKAKEVAEFLGVEAKSLAIFSEDQLTKILEYFNGFSVSLSRDRIRAIKNFIMKNIDKGRLPNKILSQLERMKSMPAKELDDFLKQYGLVPQVPTGWRGKTKIEDGNLKEGWEHIDSRHITGNHPDGPGDLFPPGTTRAELEKVGQYIVKNGRRITPINRRVHIFILRVKVNGKSMRVKVRVDASDGRILTMFPNVTGN
jgi:uncharacterized Zn finger protein